MNLVLVGLPVYLTVVLSGRQAAVKICPTSYIGIVAYASKSQAGADACIGFLIFVLNNPTETTKKTEPEKKGGKSIAYPLSSIFVW